MAVSRGGGRGRGRLKEGLMGERSKTVGIRIGLISSFDRQAHLPLEYTEAKPTS